MLPNLSLSTVYFFLKGERLIKILLFKTYLLKSSYLIWRRRWHPTPVLLPGKSHGWRSLVGCSPWGLEESDTTEQLHFHFSLSCIGEMATHSSVLAWRIPGTVESGGQVYGVVQSQTRLKWLSSSSIPLYMCTTFFFKYLFIWLHHVLVAAWELLVVSCGIQFPDQGSNLGPALGAWSLGH